PQTMISWSRLLAGRLRDPAIGRDILIGGLFAVMRVLLGGLRVSSAPWFGLATPRPLMGSFWGLLGLRGLLGELLLQLTFCMVMPMFLLLCLLLLRILLRRQWLAVAAFFIISTVLVGAGGKNVAL